MASIKNRLPELLAERFGSAGEINLQHLADQTGLTHATVSKWVKRRVNRYDDKSLIAWCKLLNCSVGDILDYVPD